MDDFLSLAEGRRSMRKFALGALPWDDVVEILRAGSFAPSVGDLQPWHFVVVTDQDKQTEIVNQCPQQDWMHNAQTLIVVTCDQAKCLDYFGEAGAHWGSQSCGACVQNMLLMAAELGIGACWVGSFDHSNVQSALGIPDGHSIEAIIALGKSDGIPEAKQIRSLEQLTFFNSYYQRMEDHDAMVRDYGRVFSRRKREAHQKVRETASSANERFAPKEKLKDVKKKLSDLFRKGRDKLR